MNLVISLLGPARILLYGDVVSFSYNKVRALLFYLCAESDRAHHRDALAELLWPERSEPAARNNLRQALTKLRNAIGDHDSTPSFLLITHETVQFNQLSNSTVDLALFTSLLTACEQCPCEHNLHGMEKCAACAERMGKAVDLYQNHFLEHFYLRDSVAFEVWVLAKREDVRRRALKALNQLVGHHAANGSYTTACHYARLLVQMDPWEEEAHRGLMSMLLMSGQRSGALMQYEKCRKVLADELGMELAAETTILYEQIRSGSIVAASHYSQPQVQPQVPLNLHEAKSTKLSTLPMAPTRLIGRELEMSSVLHLLQYQEVRLLTLTGAPGVGKTRLGLQVAADVKVKDLLPDGVCFVPLASIEDPALIPFSIAQALGVPGINRGRVGQYQFHGHSTENISGDLLKAYLQDKRTLLLLDNFEHILSAGPFVGELLATCPHLKILITSRAPLQLRGEHQFPLTPLAVPTLPPSELQRLAPETILTQYSAVELFVQRMISVRPDLNLADIDVPIVGMICAYLDGLPLAIELAAMRTKLFAPLALLARLVGRVMGSGLALLTTGARDMPARQQTMRSAIKWSYDLLPQAEQVLFRKLSMFPGWYTLEAVMAVYGAVGNTQNDGVSRAVVRDLRLAVLDGLAMLVNQSLVQCLEGEKGEPRFAMLRTLREYALELVLANSESRVMQIQLQQLASNRLCELVPGSTIFPA